MRIQITKEDLDKGIPGMATQCPLARAFRRFYGVDHVYVSCRAYIIGGIALDFTNHVLDKILLLDSEKKLDLFEIIISGDSVYSVEYPKVLP